MCDSLIESLFKRKKQQSIFLEQIGTTQYRVDTRWWCETTVTSLSNDMHAVI